MSHYEVTLNARSVKERDSDSLFYVPAGSPFRAMECADHYGLNVHTFDFQEIKAVQNFAASLADGEWLEVEPVVSSI